MNKSLRFLFLTLLCGMVLISCNTKSAQTTQSSQNTTYDIQEWIQVGDYDIFLRKIVEQKSTNSDKRLVYIEVEYANNRSKEELSCRENQWYLYDDQGYSYEVESSRDLYENMDVQYLGGERFLSQNMHLRGWLAFEIPNTATIKRVQFITAFLGTKTADIIIDELK